jgi:hypothetical protein
MPSVWPWAQARAIHRAKVGQRRATVRDCSLNSRSARDNVVAKTNAETNHQAPGVMHTAPRARRGRLPARQRHRRDHLRLCCIDPQARSRQGFRAGDNQRGAGPSRQHSRRRLLPLSRRASRVLTKRIEGAGGPTITPFHKACRDDRAILYHRLPLFDALALAA